MRDCAFFLGRKLSKRKKWSHRCPRAHPTRGHSLPCMVSAPSPRASAEWTSNWVSQNEDVFPSATAWHAPEKKKSTWSSGARPAFQYVRGLFSQISPHAGRVSPEPLLRRNTVQLALPHASPSVRPSFPPRCPVRFRASHRRPGPRAGRSWGRAQQRWSFVSLWGRLAHSGRPAFSGLRLTG